MIELKGITKTYTSKTSQKVEALKNVSFELGNAGMVFILGKSGSGKSTLLNLLGGLDSPTEGEIVVDGVSMKDFVRAQYDNYRNNYLGFIFQDFNLLKEFTVEDNVALALQLRGEKNVSDKVVNALEQVELSPKYLRRRVGELSGGEKQRVAIARCIVKDSQMVLADEPTGNLDSATAKSIWEILKKLSQTRLVVVVSHDRESAEKYADRIIEISDGQVVSDKGTQPVCEKNTELRNEVRKGLPVGICFKMGASRLRYRTARTVGVILLTIFCLIALLFTQMCVCSSYSKTLAEFIKEYGVPYIVISEPSLSEKEKENDKDGSKYAALMEQTLEYLDKHTEFIMNSTVQNKRHMLNFGFSFVGDAQELNSQSFYVTSDALEESINKGHAQVLIDGELVQVVKELHPTEFLIGKQVNLSLFYCDRDNLPILAGVVDSNAIHEMVREYTPQVFIPSDFVYKNNAVVGYWGPFYVKTSSVLNLQGFLGHLTNTYRCQVIVAGQMTEEEGGSHSQDVSEVMVEVQSAIMMFAMMSGVLCIVMVIILVLLVINLISFNIADSKKEIGILSALGASHANVAGIFICEVLVIAVICFVVALASAFGFAEFINAWFNSGFVQELNYLSVDIVSVVVLLASSFGLLTLAALIPLRKISTLNPIDAIRVA